MFTMEDVKIIELPRRVEPSSKDRILIETMDGTQLVSTMVLKSLFDKAVVFDTLEDLTYATVEDGFICTVLGNTTKNDFGAAIYIITYDPLLVPNGTTVVKLKTSDALRAVYVSVTGTITPEQMGAKGDGSKDDSKAIQACIDSGYKVICRPGSIYKIENPVYLKSNAYIEFNGATVIPVLCDAFTFKDPAYSDTVPEYTNISFMDMKADLSQGYSAINLSNAITDNITIRNFEFINVSQYGIRYSLCKRFFATNGKFISKSNSNNIGIFSDLSKLYNADKISDTNFTGKISIYNITCENVTTLLQSERGTYSANKLDIIRIYDVYYYSDISSLNNSILKSSKGEIKAIVSDVCAHNITDIVNIVDPSTSTTQNIENF